MRQWILGLIVLVLLGCGEATGGAATPIAEIPEPMQATINGVTITLESKTAPVINSPQAWIIRLERNGAPVESNDVYLDLVMPAMEMGQNKPLASPAGAGQYTASGTYTMQGEWDVSVHALIDGTDHVASFKVQVP